MFITLPSGNLLVCACGIKLRGHSIMLAHLPVCVPFSRAAEVFSQEQLFVTDADNIGTYKVAEITSNEILDQSDNMDSLLLLHESKPVTTQESYQDTDCVQDPNEILDQSENKDQSDNMDSLLLLHESKPISAQESYQDADSVPHQSSIDSKKFEISPTIMKVDHQEEVESVVNTNDFSVKVKKIKQYPGKVKAVTVQKSTTENSLNGGLKTSTDNFKYPKIKCKTSILQPLTFIVSNTESDLAYNQYSKVVSKVKVVTTQTDTCDEFDKAHKKLEPNEDNIKTEQVDGIKTEPVDNIKSELVWTSEIAKKLNLREQNAFQTNEAAELGSPSLQNDTKLYITTKDGKKIPIKVKIEKETKLKTNFSQQTDGDPLQCLLCGEMVEDDFENHEHKWPSIEPTLKNSPKPKCGEMVEDGFENHEHKWPSIEPTLKNPPKPKVRVASKGVKNNNNYCSSKKKIIQCQYCNLTYVKQHFKKHLIKKHPEVPIPTPQPKSPSTCRYCNELIPFGKWRLHYQEVHPDLPWPSKYCFTCGMIYKSLEEKIEHQKIHKPYKCDICGKEFKLNGLLKCHMTIHTGEKRFRCSVCDKTFAVKMNLRRHEDIHNGVRFKCPICPSDFSQKAGVTMHIDTVHLKKPQKPRKRQYRPKKPKLEDSNSDDTPPKPKRTKKFNNAMSSSKHSDAYESIMQSLESARASQTFVAANSGTSRNAVSNMYVIYRN